LSTGKVITAYIPGEGMAWYSARDLEGRRS
jgi:ribosomal protein S12